jgi:hypothetical protein
MGQVCVNNKHNIKALTNNVYIHFNTKGVNQSEIEMGRERKGPPSAKIVFEGELEKRVEALRIHYGIKNYTELIRMLITTRYDELRKAGEI